MIPLLILCPLILLAALGAVWKARPVHAALLLALSLSLIAVLYLAMGAGFIGLVQFMVYVGGIAILIVFSLLITRPGDEAEEVARRPKSVAVGIGCVAPVLVALLYAFSKGLPEPVAGTEPSVPLKEMGERLFTTDLPAVLAVAVLLTAVLIGAAMFARDFGKNSEPPADR
jgi:NADH-quinone oxidoreductase subunit J